MKKIFFFLLGSFALSNAIAQDDKWEKIEGNGKTVTREVNVSSFDALQASGIYELKLSQGSKETVKIEADENLQDYFNVRNEGNKLIIDMKKLENKNFSSKNKLKVYVTFKTLKELDLKTIGGANSDGQLSFEDLQLKNKSIGKVDLNFTATKLDLESKSVGSLTLTGKAQNAVIRHTGVGSIDASDFVVQTMDIENTGVGSARVNAEKNLKVKDSYLGKVSNKGSAPVRKMNRVRV